MSRVLVTGATGLIGRYCLPLLIDRGFEVHAVSRRPGHDASDMKWHQFELLHTEILDELLERVRPTHLLHLAWHTAPGAFWSSKENLAWMDASLILFRKFQRSGGRRIVASGSCAEYDWSSGICHEEKTPCRPASLYGRSKLATATYLQALHTPGAMATAWARLFLLFGPGASTARMPGVVINSLGRGEPVECSAGTQQRDFLYAPDAANAIVTLLQSDISGAINVCSGEAIAIRDLAQRTAILLGRPDLLRLGARIDSSIEAPLVVGDTNRLTSELNWKPRYTLDEGLQVTVEEQTRDVKTVGCDAA